MLVKVCGMRDAENVEQIATLGPQYMGFIFYPKSKRYVGKNFDPAIIDSIPTRIKKIGVFVNEDIAELVSIVNKYKLDGVQLHGDEPVEYLTELKKSLSDRILIIKVFQVDDSFDFSICTGYTNNSNYFLFDTKSSQYGGTGHSFDWSMLQRYTLNTPFFLSGGIMPNDAETINERASLVPTLYAADINSRFEVEPGLKNVELVRGFIESQKLQ